MDYKAKRQAFIVEVATTGFSNLSQEDKELASRHFCVAKADRDTVHSLQQQIDYGIEFNKKSVQCRLERKYVAEGEIYNRVQDVNERIEIIGLVKELLENYVSFGIEGTLEGDGEGIFDFIESRVGTSYETTGLLSKTYTVEGMDIAGLSSKMMSILKDGNY